MNQQTKLIFGLAVLVTLVSVMVWQFTGGDYYTKFEVVEEIEQSPDPDDPLTATGFYEDQPSRQTVVRREFRLGLLPTPSGLFDKHILAVATIVVPAWVIALGLLWRQRRTKRCRDEECIASQFPGVHQ